MKAKMRTMMRDVHEQRIDSWDLPLVLYPMNLGSLLPSTANTALDFSWQTRDYPTTCTFSLKGGHEMMHLLHLTTHPAPSTETIDCCNTHLTKASSLHCIESNAIASSNQDKIVASGGNLQSQPEGLQTLCFSIAFAGLPSYILRTTAPEQRNPRPPPPQATTTNRKGGIVALAGHGPHPMRGKDRLSASRPVTSIAPIRPTSPIIAESPPRGLLR